MSGGFGSGLFGSGPFGGVIPRQALDLRLVAYEPGGARLGPMPDPLTHVYVKTTGGWKRAALSAW